MELSLSTADVIATSAIFVAILALFATLWQGWLTHRHNRLSVRPHLVWHMARTNSSDSCGLIFSVRNLGLGPAVVRDRFFTKDADRFVPSDPSDEVQEFVKLAFADHIVCQVRRHGLPGKDAAISSQGEVIVADLHFPDMAFEQLSAVAKLVGGIHFFVKYEFIYGEPFELQAKRLHE